MTPECARPSRSNTKSEKHRTKDAVPAEESLTPLRRRPLQGAGADSLKHGLQLRAHAIEAIEAFKQGKESFVTHRRQIRRAQTGAQSSLFILTACSI